MPGKRASYGDVRICIDKPDLGTLPAEDIWRIACARPAWPCTVRARSECPMPCHGLGQRLYSLLTLISGLGSSSSSASSSCPSDSSSLLSSLSAAGCSSAAGSCRVTPWHYKEPPRNTVYSCNGVLARAITDAAMRASPSSVADPIISGKQKPARTQRSTEELPVTFFSTKRAGNASQKPYLLWLTVRDHVAHCALRNATPIF